LVIKGEIDGFLFCSSVIDLEFERHVGAEPQGKKDAKTLRIGDSLDALRTCLA